MFLPDISIFHDPRFKILVCPVSIGRYQNQRVSIRRYNSGRHIKSFVKPQRVLIYGIDFLLFRFFNRRQLLRFSVNFDILVASTRSILIAKLVKRNKGIIQKTFSTSEGLKKYTSGGCSASKNVHGHKNVFVT